MSKNLRRLILAMLLGVVVYGAFALWTGYGEIASCLSTFSWTAFLGACVLAIGNYLLRFAKWEYYLARLNIRGIPKSDSFLIFLSGFVLTVTPGKVGEVFKSLLLSNTHQVPVARTASIVVAERLTDALGISILIALGLRGLEFRGALVWAIVGFCLVGLGMIVIMSPRFSSLALGVLDRMPGRLKSLSPKVREAWENLRVMTSPTALILPTILSVAAWACEGFALFVILRGFSAAVPALNALFFYSTATLAGAVVPVPGGLGVTEGALNGQLMAIGGVSQGVATAAMILVRFATLWLAVLLGFLALAALRLRHPSLSSTESGRGSQA